MPVLAEHRLIAVPDRRVFEIYDADSYLGTPETLDALDEHVAASDGYHMYVGSLQSGVGVEVVIRVLDTPAEHWPQSEGNTQLTLEFTTGTLVIGEFTAGIAGEVELPKPGVYAVRVAWNGRHETADRAADIRLRGAETHASLADIRRELDALEGSERYCFDLWFLREPEREDEAEDL